ncbi:MAG: hypothetical protein KAG61_09945 [Bacteriovoracaceae bacterium]|nr:hypothetical protein [Bacteriovoracaceae bacterium]
MKLPVYEELNICSLREVKALKAKLAHSNIGKCPIYIPANELGQSDLIDFVDKLGHALQELNFSSLFPYPIYVISDSSEHLSSSKVLIIKAVEDLPKFFLKKVRSPRNKEATIMAKLKILSEKIKFIEIDKKRERIQKEFSLQDSIYLKSSELEHIRSIEKKIRERKK